jgi:hypothetical protein
MQCNAFSNTDFGVVWAILKCCGLIEGPQSEAANAPVN